MGRTKTDDNENLSKAGNSVKFAFSHYNSNVMEQLEDLQELSFNNIHELVQHCNDFLEFYLKQPRWLRFHSVTRVKCNECVYSWTLHSNTLSLNPNKEKTTFKIGNCFSLVHQHRRTDSPKNSLNNVITCQEIKMLDGDRNVDSKKRSRQDQDSDNQDTERETDSSRK